jgi:ribosome biogenesis GTPase / thiamine phosphate phosphatase
MNVLSSWGWDDTFENAWRALDMKGVSPVRVVEDRRAAYRAVGEAGDVTLTLSGRFRHGMKGRTGFPAVGDWAAASLQPAERKGTIQALLPRRTVIVRKAAGEQDEAQILGANVDVMFIVSSLNKDFNPRRVERYLALAAESGAKPVILLSKADLCADPAAVAASVALHSAGAPVVVTSAVAGIGMEDLSPHLAPGRTAVLLGSSGVGKSTIINRLLGEDSLVTAGVRVGDDRGRHTTTFRKIFQLASGALLMDTPGLRELELWKEGEGEAEVPTVFTDVEAFVAGCRFRDCAHDSDAGCAVRAAVEAGTLDPARYQNFLKMRREAAAQALRKIKASWRDNKK